MCDQETVQKVLECSVCLKPFTDPRLLPCGHTLCTECMARMVRNSRIVCPECRRRHKVGQDGVECFPPNPVVISLLDTMCKNCRKNKPETDCSHCGLHLCNYCVTSHGKLQEIHSFLDGLREAMDKAGDVVNREPLKDNIALLQEIDLFSILLHQTINDEILLLKNTALGMIHGNLDHFVEWSMATFSKLKAAQTFYEKMSYTFADNDTEYVDDKHLEEVKTQSKMFECDVLEIISQIPSIPKLCLKIKTLDIFDMKMFASIEEARPEVDHAVRNQELDNVTHAAHLQGTVNPEPSNQQVQGETAERTQQQNAIGEQVVTPRHEDTSQNPVCSFCHQSELACGSSPVVSTKIHLITDDVFAEHKGLGLFDVKNVDSDKTIQVNEKLPFCELLPLASKELQLAPAKLRLWPFAARNNRAFRPLLFNNKSKTNVGELTVDDGRLYLFVERARFLPKLPRFDPEHEVLLFLKKYDPLSECISYCGHVYMRASARINTYLMPIMRQRGGYPPEMPLLLFEEVNYKTVVKIPESRLKKPILQVFDDLQDGDIVIFQMNENLLNYKLPTVRHYLK